MSNGWVAGARRSKTRRRASPVSYLGRTMVSHGEDFEPDSDFGNCLISWDGPTKGCQRSKRLLVADATTIWLESLERSLAMMKEYQVGDILPRLRLGLGPPR